MLLLLKYWRFDLFLFWGFSVGIRYVGPVRRERDGVTLTSFCELIITAGPLILRVDLDPNREGKFGLDRVIWAGEKAYRQGFDAKTQERAEMLWAEVFTDPEFEYGPDDAKLAVADGLTGWANCEAGSKRPENFGLGMVKVNYASGVGAGLENLTRAADEILAN